MATGYRGFGIQELDALKLVEHELDKAKNKFIEFEADSNAKHGQYNSIVLSAQLRRTFGGSYPTLIDAYANDIIKRLDEIAKYVSEGKRKNDSTCKVVKRLCFTTTKIKQAVICSLAAKEPRILPDGYYKSKLLMLLENVTTFISDDVEVSMIDYAYEEDVINATISYYYTQEMDSFKKYIGFMGARISFAESLPKDASDAINNMNFEKFYDELVSFLGFYQANLIMYYTDPEYRVSKGQRIERILDTFFEGTRSGIDKWPFTRYFFELFIRNYTPLKITNQQKQNIKDNKIEVTQTIPLPFYPGENPNDKTLLSYDSLPPPPSDLPANLSPLDMPPLVDIPPLPSAINIPPPPPPPRDPVTSPLSTGQNENLVQVDPTVLPQQAQITQDANGNISIQTIDPSSSNYNTQSALVQAASSVVNNVIPELPGLPPPPPPPPVTPPVTPLVPTISPSNLKPAANRNLPTPPPQKLDPHAQLMSQIRNPQLKSNSKNKSAIHGAVLDNNAGNDPRTFISAMIKLTMESIIQTIQKEVSPAKSDTNIVPTGQKVKPETQAMQNALISAMDKLRRLQEDEPEDEPEGENNDNDWFENNKSDVKEKNYNPKGKPDDVENVKVVDPFAEAAKSLTPKSTKNVDWKVIISNIDKTLGMRFYQNGSIVDISGQIEDNADALSSIAKEIFSQTRQRYHLKMHTPPFSKDFFNEMLQECDLYRKFDTDDFDAIKQMFKDKVPLEKIDFNRLETVLASYAPHPFLSAFRCIAVPLLDYDKASSTFSSPRNETTGFVGWDFFNFMSSTNLDLMFLWLFHAYVYFSGLSPILKVKQILVVMESLIESVAEIHFYARKVYEKIAIRENSTTAFFNRLYKDVEDNMSKKGARLRDTYFQSKNGTYDGKFQDNLKTWAWFFLRRKDSKSKPITYGNGFFAMLSVYYYLASLINECLMEVSRDIKLPNFDASEVEKKMASTVTKMKDSYDDLINSIPNSVSGITLHKQLQILLYPIKEVKSHVVSVYSYQGMQKIYTKFGVMPQDVWSSSVAEEESMKMISSRLTIGVDVKNEPVEIDITRAKSINKYMDHYNIIEFYGRVMASLCNEDYSEELATSTGQRITSDYDKYGPWRNNVTMGNVFSIFSRSTTYFLGIKKGDTSYRDDFKDMLENMKKLLP